MCPDQQVSGSDLHTPCSENDQWSSKASSKIAPSARAEVAPLRVDWTRDDNGRSNSSELFRSLMNEVAQIIRNGAHSLLCGDSEQVARTIMATLAHRHGFGPEVEPGYAVVSSADLLLVLDYVPLAGSPIPDYAVERLRWQANDAKDRANG